MEEEMFEADYNGGVNEGDLPVYTAYEIDLDYEFDAARIFDFIRGESPRDILQAEAWFDSATGYPPSRPTFYNDFKNNVNSKCRDRLPVKSTFPWSSTLMKPTASHLAKQKHPFQGGHSRSHTSVLDGTSKTSTSSSGIESQAAKRQKLEGGLLRKVMGEVQLQPTNFVHKAPKLDKSHYENTPPTKPRFTVPRDPDLETARRAQRAMERSSRVGSANSTVRRFKALPLNRKILETPQMLPKRSTPRAPDFQEFHLKTSERAAKQISSNGHHPIQELHKCSNNLTACESRQPGRLDGYKSSHSFRASPFNRKTSMSKEDIGACRSSKNETTVPMDLNFRTEKRSHPTPPVELFNKLSLMSETQPSANPERYGPVLISIPENR